jgi:hypothetical protein
VNSAISPKRKKKRKALCIDVSLGYPYVETFEEGYENAMGTP